MIQLQYGLSYLVVYDVFFLKVVVFQSIFFYKFERTSRVNSQEIFLTTFLPLEIISRSARTEDLIFN